MLLRESSQNITFLETGHNKEDRNHFRFSLGIEYFTTISRSYDKCKLSCLSFIQQLIKGKQVHVLLLSVLGPRKTTKILQHSNNLNYILA